MAPPPKMTLQIAIAAMRIKANWQLTDVGLAKRCDVSLTSLKRWRKRAKAVPSARKQQQLSRRHWLLSKRRQTRGQGLTRLSLMSTAWTRMLPARRWCGTPGACSV